MELASSIISLDKDKRSVRKILRGKELEREAKTKLQLKKLERINKNKRPASDLWGSENPQGLVLGSVWQYSFAWGRC